MNPNGQLVRRADGVDLVLTRSFRAPIADVWDSVTEPESTARWFGPWKGRGAPGRTVQVQMAYEDEPVWCDVQIEACEPPTRLAIAMDDANGLWRMELLLAESAGMTELRLIHHLNTADGVGAVGPGWEWYLDRLVASRAGVESEPFDAYYPSMEAYYVGLASDA